MPKKKAGKRPAAKRSATHIAAVRIKPGPRKNVVEGPPPPRYTTHKVRARWFQQRASYPVREAGVAKLVAERERVRPAVPVVANWEPIGPTNIGGRCTSLAVHPTNADTIYAGSAGGGVWR